MKNPEQNKKTGTIIEKRVDRAVGNKNRLAITNAHLCFDQVETIDEGYFTVTYGKSDPVFVYVPYVRAIIKCKSSILDKMSVLSKYIIVQLKKNIASSVIEYTVGLYNSYKDEINILIEGGLVDQEYNLTSLGEYYADLIETLKPLEYGKNALLNLYTNEFEIEVNEPFSSVDENDDNLLPDRILYSQTGRYLLRNENYSNSLELILSTIIQDEYPKDLIESLYTTIKIQSYEKLYVKRVIPFVKPNANGTHLIDLYVCAKKFVIKYESEDLDEMRDCLDDLLRIKSRDVEMLSEYSLDIIDLYQREETFKPIEFIKSNILNIENQKEIVRIEDIPENAIVCVSANDYKLRMEKIRGLRHVVNVEGCFIKVSMDYSQLLFPEENNE